MITSIKHKGLAAFFYNGETKGLKQSLLKRVGQILALLNTAIVYSVSASGNWRVIFKFEDGNAYDVDLIDYH